MLETLSHKALSQAHTIIEKLHRGYRYHFNSQERDDEIYGQGNSYTAEFWQYDARLGRRWNLDPKPQISISDYACFGGNPINNIDENGDYFVGIFGQKVRVRETKSGNIKVGIFATKDLKRMAKLINMSGSNTAKGLFLDVANNPSRVHFKIENAPVENGMEGLHQVHDNKGNALNWDSEASRFIGTPAFIETNEGLFYKEATITLFEGNTNQILENLKNDGFGLDLNLNDELVSNFSHEATHNIDKKSIEATKSNSNNDPSDDLDFDYEGPAELNQIKTDEELKTKKK